MSVVALPSATQVRVEILDLRQRIEKAAAEAFDAAWAPGQTGAQNRTERRLAHLWTLAGSTSYAETLEVIRTSRHVYKKTSDVLHGRHGMVTVPGVVIDEWKTVVDHLEALTSVAIAE
jgi:thioesterase domain-containing protein